MTLAALGAALVTLAAVYAVAGARRARRVYGVRP